MTRFRNLFLTSLAIVLLLSFQSSAGSIADSGGSTVQPSIVVDGLIRNYLLYTPAGVKHPMPLVLVLHGGGGKPDGMEKLTGMDAVADKHSFIVAYPQGIGMVFNDGGSDLGQRLPRDDVHFIRSLIDDAAQHAPVDKTKVFVCGFSNGGAMSTRLALEASDVIKAAAVVGSGLYVKQAQALSGVKPIAMMFVEGTSDPCHPFKGGEARGPYMKGTIFDGAAHGQVLSTDDLIAFWRKVNHCGGVAQRVAIPHIASDSTSSTYERYEGADHKDVVLYTVSGGGHCWPGGLQYFPVSVIGKTTYDFSASEAIWRFFAAHGGVTGNL